MDINSKEFRKVLRGYDSNDVDEFLDKISEDYEALYKENSSLKEKMSLFEEKLNHYSKLESTIQNTLLLAQNAAEQAKSASQKEAEIIVKTANEAAHRILDKANNDVYKISSDYDIVKNEFSQFRYKYRNFMNTQIELFSNLENEFVKQHNIGTAVEENQKVEVQPDYSEDEKKDEEQSINDDLSTIKSFYVEE